MRNKRIFFDSYAVIQTGPTRPRRRALNLAGPQLLLCKRGTKWGYVLSANDVVLQLDGIVLQRDDTVLQLDDAVLQPNGIVLQLDDIVLQRDDSALQCDYVVVQRDDIVLQPYTNVTHENMDLTRRDKDVLGTDGGVSAG